MGVDVAGQRAQIGHEAGVVVAHLRERQHRQTVREAVHLHEAAEGLADAVEGGATDVVRIARLAEAGDVHDGQARVDLPQHLVGHAPLGHLTAAEAVHEDVGVFQQFEEPCPAGALFHVHAQRARVAALHLSAPALQRGPGGTRGVAAERALNADDVGAEVGQQPAGEGAGDGHGQVHDPHALQGAEFRALFCFHSILLLRLAAEKRQRLRDL